MDTADIIVHEMALGWSAGHRDSKRQPPEISISTDALVLHSHYRAFRIRGNRRERHQWMLRNLMPQRNACLTVYHVGEAWACWQPSGSAPGWGPMGLTPKRSTRRR